MNSEEINTRLIAMAESVRAEELFDVDFKIKKSEFFRLEFDRNIKDQVKVNNSIYKYTKK